MRRSPGALRQGLAGHRRALRGSPPRYRASGAHARGAVSRARAARRRPRRLRQPSPSMPSRRTPSCRASRAQVRNFPTTAPRELRIDVRAEQPFAPLDAFLRAFEGRVLLAADSAGPARGAARDAARARPRGERSSTAGRRLPTARRASRSPWRRISQGLTLTAPPIAVIAEAQLFGARARQERRRAKRAADPEAILRDLQDLNPGAPVVHEEYGVGRYLGLHADGDRRPARGVPGARVPGRRPHLRAGARAAPGEPLHRRRARARPAAQARHRPVGARAPARRRADPRRGRGAARPVRAAQGAAGPRAAGCSELDYQAFANAFPFEETEDQAQAIRQVLSDLQSERPDGPHRVRRCRLRQDRGGDARGVRRGARRQAGRGARARRRCWCSSTWRTSATASPTGRCAWRRCRASATRRRRRRCSRASSRARWTSSSPRTACCTRTRASRTSGS